MELFSKLLLFLALSTPVGGFLNILGTALKVAGFIVDSFTPDDHKPVTKAEVEKMMHELSEEIQSSETKILQSIMLQSRFDRLDDAIIQIRSSSEDLRNYINASMSTKDSFKSIFITNYENGAETSLIRFLPMLLTYQNSGRQDTLLTLLLDDTRCNISALERFKTFYCKLLSSGIAINVAYDVLKFQMSKEEALKEWTNTPKEIEVKFQTSISHCAPVFRNYAKQDLTEARSASALHVKNNAWKPWKKNDVIFSDPYGSYQFVYFDYEDDTVIWQKTNTENRVAVFYQPYLYENDNRLPSNILKDSTDRFRSAIDGVKDEVAAKHVAGAVQKLLLRDGYIIESLVVLFEEGYCEEILDPDSPVVKATVDNVQLSKPFDTPVSGSFKIFVYAHEANVKIEHYDHHTDAANSLANMSLVLSFVTLTLTTVTVW